jgi:hypothetical protein
MAWGESLVSQANAGMLGVGTLTRGDRTGSQIPVLPPQLPQVLRITHNANHADPPQTGCEEGGLSERPGL